MRYDMNDTITTFEAGTWWTARADHIESLFISGWEGTGASGGAVADSMCSCLLVPGDRMFGPGRARSGARSCASVIRREERKQPPRPNFSVDQRMFEMPTRHRWYLRRRVPPRAAVRRVCPALRS